MRMSEAQAMVLLGKHYKKPRDTKPKAPKYKNTKVKLDGKTFDSQKEAKRYQTLKLEVQSGRIMDLNIMCRLS